jgi:hypothetical protein
VEALEKGLKVGQPEIINSDQGSQYTSKMWEESITDITRAKNAKTCITAMPKGGNIFLM